jgi:hypothetical protein
MILVDLNESYQNITKSPHIARKKVPLLWGQKWCVFFFAPKRYLTQGKPSKKNLCTTTRQELSESPSYDLTRPSVRKKMGGQKIHFFKFWVF